MSARQNIENDARNYGFNKTVDPASHKVMWEITCKKCKKTEAHGWGPTTSAELMVRNMRLRGWGVSSNSTPKCKDCRRPTRFDRRYDEPAVETKGQLSPPIMAIKPATSSPVLSPVLSTAIKAADVGGAIGDALHKAIVEKLNKEPQRDIVMSESEFSQIKAYCSEMIHRLTKYQELFTRLSTKSKALG